MLRRAGIPVGSGEVLLALTAVESLGIERIGDLREGLAATLLHRREHRDLFDAAFAAVLLASATAPSPDTAVPAPRSASARNQRLASALALRRSNADSRSATLGPALRAASDLEALRHRDFEQMSAEEARAALDLVRRAAHWWRRPTRRWQPSARRDDLDLRRTLRELARRPDSALWHWRERQDRPTRLVMVCDVSGSMRTYSRGFLQLAHALAGRDRAVELFAFATRLTRLTAWLRVRDPDQSLARMGTSVQDWDSGTRIGAALARLVKEFAPSVLGSSSIVVLLTDGLERGPPEELRAAAKRLKRSCREVLWLNPLLRYPEYAPLARGAAVLAETLRPARPAHDPASLEALVRSLDALRRRREPNRVMRAP